jgi:hypothetical protein
MSAKSSVEVDKLSKALARAQQQMAAIDRFGSARGGFADARTRFREAQAAVEKAARAMKAGEGDAKQLARAYENRAASGKPGRGCIRAAAVRRHAGEKRP